MGLPRCLPENFYRTSNCNRNHLHPYIQFVDKCTFKERERCQVRCINQFVLIGQNFIICYKSRWINVPECFPNELSPYKLFSMRCAFPPPIPGNVRITGICSPNVGISCNLTCRDNPTAKISGPNATTCLFPGLWSKVKPCEGGKTYCPAPILPKHLEVISDCSGVETNSECNIRCKQRKELNFTLICRSIAGWNRYPNCPCPPPSIQDPLLLKEKCNLKYPGERCHLKCKRGYALEQTTTIRCLDQLEWTAFPVCTKLLCPKPKLTASLTFHENCASKMSGEYCQLECRERGLFVKEDKIKCIDGLFWTALPNCTCPLPKLSDNLEFISNCTSVMPYSTCSLTCKEYFYLVGHHFITCQENMKWSILPRCKKITCPEPLIPTTIFFSEDCTSKTFGEHCLLRCRYGGKLLGSNKITCKKEKKWSLFPKCACPPPVLIDYLLFAENCSTKFPGERCSLKCKKEFSSAGSIFILCQNDTRWSPFPMCKRKPCIKNILPKSLEYVGDCAELFPGEKCEVECREGGKMHGVKYIQCIQGTSWTVLPDCSCPIPTLPDALEEDEDCKNVKVGERCYLKCKKTFRLKGKNYIICLSNTRWSPLPKCEKVFCPKPKLPKSLIFNEDCSFKSLGETCRLKCREGGDFLELNMLTCIENEDTVKWTSFPSCTCPSPMIDNDLKMVENCKFKIPGEICLLECVENSIIIGKSYISCQNNTKWSKLPICREVFCSKPILPNELIFREDCSSKVIGDACSLECRTGGRTIQDSKIYCITLTTWSSLPNCSCPPPFFPLNLNSLEDCSSKQPGQVCKVFCKEKFHYPANSHITCGANFRWNNFPSCNLRHCSKPVLPSYLQFDEDCSKKIPGNACRLLCKMEGEIAHGNKIKCLKQLKWTSFPICTCPNPNLSPGLLLTETCSFKTPGEICLIECQKNLELYGKNFVMCRNNFKWTIEPKCLKRNCSKPNLPSHLMFKENCSSKGVKERCELLCKHGGTMKGENYIECYSSLKWSEFPICFCPFPKLNEKLKFLDNCFNKSAGDKCLLKCKSRLKTSEIVSIYCQEKGSWTSLPICSNTTCSTPNLTNSIVLKENCSAKYVNEICRLKCEDPFMILGKDFIECQDDATWSTLPRCIERMCSEPVFSRSVLTLKGACLKKVGSFCVLSCKLGGEIIGDSKIVCLNNYTWSTLPDCTCPSPLLKNNLKGNCSYTRRGQKCNLYCEYGLQLEGSDFITCQNDTNWSSQPFCIRKTCPKPEIPEAILQLEENCSSKYVGDSCKISCKQGGKLIGSKFIKCHNNSEWSTLPDCSCPEPQLTDEVEIKDNCTFKKRGEICKISCKNNMRLIGKESITCLNDTQWTPLPFCQLLNCSVPQLHSYLTLKEKCSSSNEGESCELICVNKGTLLGNHTIKCTDGKTWSQFPDCTCPPLILNESLVAEDGCGHKKRGENCTISCKENSKMLGQNLITCLENAEWSQLPKCVSVCLNPEFPEYLETNDNCSSKHVGERCETTCKQGGKMIGNNTIECLVNQLWSPFPECLCPSPFLGDDLEVVDNCDEKKIGDICKVKCIGYRKLKDGEFLTCLNNTKWSMLPKCASICSEIILPAHLAFNGICDSKTINETCSVKCMHEGKLLENATVKCLTENEWSALPNCTCPPPLLTGGVVNKTDCNEKKKGEICELMCRKNKKMIGKNFIMCLENITWSISPKCDMIICAEPKLPTYLSFKGDCFSKEIGELCEVECNQNGLLLGDTKIRCMAENTWSEYPTCACSKPNLTEYLKTEENCDSKKVNEQCKMTCMENKRMLGEDLLTCQENATWTMLPKCVAVCFEPTLPKYLRVEGNCSSIIVGGTCEVECVQKGQILGNSSLRCIAEKEWSPPPICTCPPPPLAGGVINIEDCNKKKISDTCKVKCRENSKLSGNNFLTCLEDTTWSSLPKCDMITCVIPVLPEYLSFKGDCFSKLVKESCEVQCHQNGSIIGNNLITCLSDQEWSEYPDCTCPLPHLSEDFSATENCSSKKRGDTCRIKCKGTKKLIGQNFLTCLENRKWSSSPICAFLCSTPKLPKYLTFNSNCSSKVVNDSCEVSCSQNGSILGEPAITCLSEKNWSKWPDCTCPAPLLPADLKTAEKCNLKKHGDSCKTECSGNQRIIGQSSLMCQESRKWSILPKCAQICPVPVLPDYLELNGNCSSKVVNETCEVSCTQKRHLLGNNTIRCIPNNKWSSLPNCTCPPPSLKGGVISTEDCNKKEIGESCKVGCRRQSKMTGNNYLTCLPNMEWSSLPKCDIITCSNPTLPSYLAFKGGCYSKLIGESCEVQCEQKGSILGKTVITCVSEQEWSQLPDCTCPSPVLQKHHLEMIDVCDLKKKGDLCKVRCKGNKKLVGSNILTCRENRKWSSLPVCTSICSVPQLPKYLAFSGNCSSKIVGESCRVKCTQNGTMIGSNLITCLSENSWSKPPECTCSAPVLTENLSASVSCNTKSIGDICKVSCMENTRLVGKSILTCENNASWSPAPICASVCSVPKLPLYLKLEDSCSSQIIGETCRVKCLQNRHIIGNPSIKCLTQTSWTSLPTCTCPPPYFTGGVINLGDCNKKKEGEVCHVKCRENSKLKGNNYLICLKNATWSAQPKCDLITCSNPKLPHYLTIKGNCFSKFKGESCELRCNQNGNIVGKAVITCLSEHEWSELPDCTCPPPHLSRDLETLTLCDFKKKGESCELKCYQNKRLIGQSTLMCQENRKWSSLPTCATLCSRPKLPKYLSLKESCSSKIVKEFCEVKCAQNGNIIGKNLITCVSENNWGKYPECTCPTPTSFITANLKVMANCDNKKMGEICNVSCKGNKRLLGQSSLTCRDDATWSHPPTCVSVCSVPKLPNYLQLEGDCSNQIIGETCKVNCVQSRHIIGNPLIKCLTQTNWSVLPTCTCPPPSFRGGILNLEDCNKKKIGDVCRVSCRKNSKMTGNNFLTCLNDATWSLQPTCDLITCRNPTLPAYLTVKGNCFSKLIGESCEVQCSQNGRIIGRAEVACLNEHEWSKIPDCTCPPPHLSGDLKANSVCNYKKKGDTCEISCKENKRIIGENILTCQDNRKWSSQPKCVSICSKPKIPSYLELEGKCSSQIIGETCKVNCVQNRKIIGNPSIKCLTQTSWTSLPTCTCPPPSLRGGVLNSENCNEKKIGEICRVSCKKNSKMTGNNFLTCLEDATWTSQPKCDLISCSSPKLPIYLSIKGICVSKFIGETCEIRCTQNGNIIGAAVITCLSEHDWSEFPDCACSQPHLSVDLETKKSCDSKKKGDVCEIRCKENKRLIGQNTLTCQENRKWSPQPKCASICSKPNLPKYLILKDACSAKIVGESCQVKCAQKGNIVETNLITCLSTNDWSKYPECTCPSPSLTANLRATVNCDHKKIGDVCSVSCVGNKRLVGQNVLKCQSDALWSKSPTCASVCSAPKLPPYLKFEGNCTSQIIGESCKVNCAQNRHVIGNPLIKCLTLTHWTVLPTCTCPPPALRGGVINLEDCNEKKIGEVCRVSCRKNSKMTGNNFLTCLEGANWSLQPKCDLITCLNPRLPVFLAIKGNCFSKLIGESCEVQCSQNGSIIGRNVITCLSEHAWSTFPDCTCSPLLLSSDLKTKDNCNFKKKGEVCEVSCKGNQKIIGQSTLTCQENRKWSSALPKCSSMCSEPKLPAYLNLRSKCTSKVVGETCHLTCSQGGKLIAKSQIQCLLGSNWSSFPECTCPNPVLPRKLNIVGSCVDKKRGEICTIGCKRHYKLKGNNKLTCGVNAKWNFRALCVTRCRKPKLPFYLILTENCSSKGVGESCNVNCRNKDQMIGNAKIICQKMHKWTSLPDCLCPPPTFTNDLEAGENCNSKKRGDVCKIRCKGNKKIRGHKTIMCFNSTRWSSLRSTQCMSPKCRMLFPPSYIKFESPCVNPVVGKSCSLVCTQRGRMIGSKVIRCLSNGTWTALPDCTCPQPRMNPDLEIVSRQCRDLRIGKYCQLTCKDRKKRIEGDGRMRCQRNARWPRFPKCRTVCPEPKWFKTWLRSDSTCKNIAIGERCVLRCKWEKEGSKFIQGINYMICLRNLTWSKMPECYCPPPVMPEGMVLVQDCSKLVVGNRCPVGCTAGYHLKDPRLNYLYCTSSTSTWGQWPVCLKT
ncbi:uncharacterized protein [Parasteatoda tepidariorum]|uniref:uncharacterized protein n=1 Tax=Parasteatoda tepidariorum TaxID=114398 RepID=UPI0039BCB2BF